VQRVLQEATQPEAREAWERELEMEGIPWSDARSDEAGTSKDLPPCANEAAGDRVVGHRVVRASPGEVRVPVYEADDGARYYVSPLTSRRVTIPS